MRIWRLVQFAGAVAAATIVALPLLRAQEPKSDPAATIRQVLESRFPGTKVMDVQSTPLPGIYEVYVGDRIVYADASADHLIIGSILDTRTRSDLTKARMEERGRIDFKSLPFDKAIKVVKGNGSRQIAVFEDPDCPYCQRLEKELVSIQDVTEYIFLFPIDSLHPQATQHAREIWCAPDRSRAWTQWLLEKKPPPAATCKDDPSGELAKLGDKLYIDGTPTSFLANGKRVGGAVPAEELEKALTAASGPPASAGAKPAAGASPAPAAAPKKP